MELNKYKKIMEIYARSKMFFNDWVKEQRMTDDNIENYDCMLISINDSNTNDLRCYTPYFKRDHPNVITLHFDDVENENETSPTNSGKCIPFSQEMCTKLYKFIKANLDKPLCFCHCLAGISRSGAVGSFIQGLTGSNWEEFKLNNPQIVPNPRITRMLNREKYKDIS